MSTSQTILEYLKVLLSGPPVWATCAFVLALIFRKDIVALIGRIVAIKTPFGEFSASQRVQTEALKGREAIEGGPPSPTLSADLELRLPNELKSLPQDKLERLRDFAEAEQERARLWEYRYLNRLLVPNTQAVLDWVAGLGKRTNLQLVDATLAATIPDPNERSAILSVLLTHHLLQRSGEQIELTPKGREYISWRGPLPPMRSVPPARPVPSLFGISPSAAPETKDDSKSE